MRTAGLFFLELELQIVLSPADKVSPAMGSGPTSGAAL